MTPKVLQTLQDKVAALRARDASDTVSNAAPLQRAAELARRSRPSAHHGAHA